MNKKKVYILEDRGILFVQGKDAREYLQNLISNILNSPRYSLSFDKRYNS